jgi:hypothetical protein
MLLPGQLRKSLTPSSGEGKFWRSDPAEKEIAV